jgi:hypothetical protein
MKPRRAFSFPDPQFPMRKTDAQDRCAAPGSERRAPTLFIGWALAHRELDAAVSPGHRSSDTEVSSAGMGMGTGARVKPMVGQGPPYGRGENPRRALL